MCMYIYEQAGSRTVRAVVMCLDGWSVVGLQKQHRRHAASTTKPALDRRPA